MQRLEVSGAVRPIYRSLDVEGLVLNSLIIIIYLAFLCSSVYPFFSTSECSSCNTVADVFFLCVCFSFSFLFYDIRILCTS